MPPQDVPGAPDPARRMSSRGIKIGMLSVLSVTLVACGSQTTTARCVDRQVYSGGRYQVVPDTNCNTSGSYGRYFWYYGGRSSGGFAYEGSTIRPKGHKIKSSSGKTITRGGFGGRSSGHGGG